MHEFCNSPGAKKANKKTNKQTHATIIMTERSESNAPDASKYLHLPDEKSKHRLPRE